MPKDNKMLLKAITGRLKDIKYDYPKGEKIKRDAFLYFNPKGKNQKQFAQCGTCIMFTGSTCTILGKRFKVEAGDSCGLYVNGPPMPEEKGNEMKAVTPDDAGFVSRQVRCENCKYGDAKRLMCTLFEDLNKSLKDHFDLDPKINALGCCNAQTPR